jgi:hypothetical protein
VKSHVVVAFRSTLFSPLFGLDNGANHTVEVMDWKEGVSRTVGEKIGMSPDASSASVASGLEMGMNILSWTP